MIPDMIHTPYIAPRISVMAPPPVTAERFVDELLSGLCPTSWAICLRVTLLPISLPAEILSPTVGMRQ